MSKQSVKPSSVGPWVTAVRRGQPLRAPWPAPSASGSPRLSTGSNGPKANALIASIGRPLACTHTPRPPLPPWEDLILKIRGDLAHATSVLLGATVIRQALVDRAVASRAVATNHHRILARRGRWDGRKGAAGRHRPEAVSAHGRRRSGGTG